jgi:hypothetical protein
VKLDSVPVLADNPFRGVHIGVVRKGLDHNKGHSYSREAYFLSAQNGSLCGRGKMRESPQGGMHCIDVFLYARVTPCHPIHSFSRVERW